MRLPSILVTLGLTAAALVAAAPSASAAAPVSGHLTAHVGTDYRSGCEVDSDGLYNTVAFSNSTGPRTAQIDGHYTVSDTGAPGDPVAATAYGSIETTASAAVRKRSFKRLDVESTGVVVLGNDAAADCSTSFEAASSAVTTLKVRARGRIRIAWDSHVGDVDLLSLVGPAGVVFSRDPAQAAGTLTVRVAPGTYKFETSFVVAANESEVEAGGSLNRVGYYTLRASYLPPA